MKTDNSYTGMFVDPSTGSESAMLLSEPLNKKYRMSNLHLLDWQWTPEKGSPAWERRRSYVRPKDQYHVVKVHVKDSGCYQSTLKRARTVTREDFRTVKEWERCRTCTRILQEDAPRAKPKKREVPFEKKYPGTYIEPVEWTPEQRASLGRAKKAADKNGVRPDHYVTPHRTKVGDNATLTRL